MVEEGGCCSCGSRHAPCPPSLCHSGNQLYEPNDDIADAEKISLSSTEAQKHDMDAGDVDYMKFSATSGDVVTVTVMGLGVCSDVDVEILDPAKKSVTTGRAKLVADQAAASGMNWNTLYVATGANFPDALAGGAALAKNGGIMLLVDPANLSSNADAKAAMQTNSSKIGKCYLLGGNGALSVKVKGEIGVIVGK
ncbi:MAG: cell wall-binding repeat-containing protein [Actinomycetota bacterium]|nr:cell wall-binding repeat-containing protein [Actinomycetota bacterium]